MTSNFTYRYLAMTPEHTSGTGARSYGTASALDNSDGAGGTTAKVYGEVDDESIQHRFDLMTRGDISRYGAAKSVNGKEYSEGGINYVAQPDDLLGLCLYGIYGDSSTPGSGGYSISGFIHTMVEHSLNLLPSFTIEVGREEKEHTYTGVCINRLGISAAQGEYTTMSVDFTGKSESANTTLASSVTFGGASVDGFHFADGTVTFSEAGSASVSSTKIKSISVDFNMNLDTDAACSIGNRTYVRQPEPQMREITGTVEFSDASTTSATNVPGYDMTLSTGGKLYDGNATEPAIKLTFSNGTQSYELSILRVRWEAPAANVSGRDTQSLSLNFVALLDDADNTMTKSVLTLDAPSSNLASGIKYSLI
jgi:hypothetical protein